MKENDRLIEEKQRTSLKQKEEDRKFASKYRKESEDYILDEKAKQKRIKEYNLRYQVIY